MHLRSKRTFADLNLEGGLYCPHCSNNCDSGCETTCGDTCRFNSRQEVDFPY